jgi:hypothetical protein
MPASSTIRINSAVRSFCALVRTIVRHVLAISVLTVLSLAFFGITLEEKIREVAVAHGWADGEANWTASLDAIKNGDPVLRTEFWTVPSWKGTHDFNPLDWGRLLHPLRT